MSQLAKVGPLCRMGIFPLCQCVRLVESENNKWDAAFGMSRSSFAGIWVGVA